MRNWRWTGICLQLEHLSLTHITLASHTKKWRQHYQMCNSAWVQPDMPTFMHLCRTSTGIYSCQPLKAYLSIRAATAGAAHTLVLHLELTTASNLMLHIVVGRVSLPYWVFRSVSYQILVLVTALQVGAVWPCALYNAGIGCLCVFCRALTGSDLSNSLSFLVWFQVGCSVHPDIKNVLRTFVM